MGTGLASAVSGPFSSDLEAGSVRLYSSPAPITCTLWAMFAEFFTSSESPTRAAITRGSNWHSGWSISCSVNGLSVDLG